MMKKEDIKEYFRRIKLEYNENEPCDSVLLGKLQYAHITSVPYETTEIVDRHPLSLDVDDLFRKIVTEGRGGYCFELNGLFGELLRSLGYEVSEYAARFLRGEPEPPKPRHRVLVAQVDGKRWLCDVGVGCKAPRYPVLIEIGTEQEICGEWYKMETDEFLGNVLMEMKDGKWQPYFSFNDCRQMAKDFTTLSFYCENHPDSPFLVNMLSLKTEKGRYTIDKNEFRIWENDTVIFEKSADEAGLEKICLEYFGMTLHR